MSRMPSLPRKGCVFGERRARTKRGFRIPACRAASREHASLIVAARKGRNTALYDTAGTVSPSFVAEVTRVVSELLEQVRHR